MDNRHIQRIAKKGTVTVEELKGIALDMSKTGMKFLLPGLLRKKEVVINLSLAGMSVLLRGWVCWIRKEFNIYREPQYKVGVRLSNPPSEYMKLVEKN